MSQEYELVPAAGLLNLAWEYSEAAKRVDGASELKNVSRFLTCRSVELALKAFLRAKGLEKDELKRLGHNLEKALKEAENAGLGEVWRIDQEFRVYLIVLNTWYEFKDFEYPFAAPELPTVWTQPVMDALIE